MKTVFINCSPKKRFCASAYFLFLQGLSVKGKKVTEKLRNPSDHQRILEQIKDAQTVVFGVPLYVDGVPSHVLRFMEVMETYCRENGIRLNVYVVANNGFIEGKQNEPLMQIFSNFCSRAGLFFGGGVGIGGGVMLNATRILFIVDIAILILNLILTAVNGGSLLEWSLWESFLVNAAWIIYLNAGLLFYLFRMGSFISKGGDAGKKYTRILIPSFIFILFADIFFVIISVIEGGIFRGWLAKKTID